MLSWNAVIEDFAAKYSSVYEGKLNKKLLYFSNGTTRNAPRGAW